MVDFGELHGWIDTHNFSRRKSNLNRDFSDGVLLAELLKIHYPKIVELHNYSPQNSLDRKLNNWDTLNRKVLKRLGLGISKGLIEDIATAQPGAIEKLLLKTRIKIEHDINFKSERDSDSENSEEMSELSGPTVKVPIRTRNGNEEIIVEQRLNVESIARAFDELWEKNEAVNILNQKVDHLDSLIRLKDQRIEDLTRQLQKYHTFGQMMKNLSTKSAANLSEPCD